MSSKNSYNFFTTNLAAMQRGYMRPRYNGYLHFQDHAGDPIREYMMGKNVDAKNVLEKLNKIYKQAHPRA